MCAEAYLGFYRTIRRVSPQTQSQQQPNDSHVRRFGYLRTELSENNRNKKKRKESKAKQNCTELEPPLSVHLEHRPQCRGWYIVIASEVINTRRLLGLEI